jgi:tetratricopeptide (TPR) repeat protein
MNEPRPVRPSGRRPLSSPPPRRVPAPPSKGPGKGVWIAAGAGAVVLLIAAIAMLGGKKNEPEPAPVAQKPPPPKIVVPPPTPPPAPPPPPPPVVPKPVTDPAEEKKAKQAEDARLRRAEGQTRTDGARKEVAADLEREKKETAAFERRFSGLRLDVKLTSNQVHKGALVVAFTPDDLGLTTADGKSIVVPWMFVSPESIAVLADHVYREVTADTLLEKARFLVDRRMWKEAQATLHRLKKVDEEREGLADAFDEAAGSLLTGKGLFQAAYKTTGESGLRLAYDFSDPAQADDFKGAPQGLEIEGGKLTLESDKRRLWTIGDMELEFVNDVDVEATVSVTGALLFVFHQAENAPVYVLETGPKGTFLKRGPTVSKAEEIAKNPASVIKGTQPLRLTVRGRKVALSIGGRPALTFDDASGAGEARGRFSVGVFEGKVVFGAPMVVSGQVNPDYLRKEIGTIEMAARRAISKDLGEVRELNAQQVADQMLGGTAEGISADKDTLLDFLEVRDLADYVALKLALTQGAAPSERERLLKLLDGWLEKHPGCPSFWYLRAVRHLNEAEVDQARDKLTKAVALRPDFYEAHYQLARTWWIVREFGKALDDCRKALEIRPDYVNALILAAQMRFALDKKASAEIDVEFRVAEKLGANAAEMLHERRRVRMVTRGPRDLGCVHELESPNYLIVTDISPERAAWYASQLEVVRAHYLDAFKKWYTGDARPKPRIAIFNTREAFYTYTELSSTSRRENWAGFFDPANNELVLFEDLDLEQTLQVLYHEAFHHFASAMLKYPPYWWNEGIAEYMSALKLDPQGKKIQERARLLEGRLQNIQMALTADYYVPFETILNYTPGQFYSGPVWLHYAQGWAMIHFLYEYESGRYRPLIEQYFDELVRGKTQRQAFDAVFQGKTAELQKEWLKFTKALKKK